MLLSTLRHSTDSGAESRAVFERNDLRMDSPENQSNELISSVHSDSSVPEDWQNRENRLDLAVVVSSKQSQGGGNFNGISSLESLLVPLLEKPGEAGLIGFALGYGFAARLQAGDRLPVPSEVSAPEIYTRFLLPGILASRERQPNPLQLLESIEVDWGSQLQASNDLAGLCEICIRFAAESGNLDPDKAIDALTHAPKMVGKDGKPVEAAAERMIETAATLSPLTFDALMRRLEERYPGITTEILSNANIPSEMMVSLIQTLPKKAKDEFARRLSRKVINGTPAEIEKAAGYFPNPAEIPNDAALNLTFAIALLGPDRLEAWLGKLDTKQLSKVTEQLHPLIFSQRGFPVEQRIQLLELRASQILRTPCISKDLPEIFNHVRGMMEYCKDPQVFQNLVESLTARADEKSREVREAALRSMYKIKAEREGSESLVSIILDSSPASSVEDRKIAEHNLVTADRKRAEKLLGETSDQALAFRLDEELILNPDFSLPSSHYFQVLADRLTTPPAAGITPATAKAVGFFVRGAAYEDRSMAVSLIDKLPEGDLRQETTKALASIWAGVDPIGASEWLATLSPSRSRDVAVSELVQASHDDPEMALANAAAIQDPALRSKAAGTVVARWKGLNPEAILQLIEASPMSPPDKEALGKLVYGDPKDGGSSGKK